MFQRSEASPCLLPVDFGFAFFALYSMKVCLYLSKNVLAFQYKAFIFLFSVLLIISVMLTTRQGYAN